MSSFEIECRYCDAHLLTPILAAAVRFDQKHTDCKSKALQ